MGGNPVERRVVGPWLAFDRIMKYLDLFLRSHWNPGMGGRSKYALDNWVDGECLT